MAACRIPLVVVLGSTGAGKSKLAIEIAKAFKGEIISADSMQIYKGLDIITNKVTEEEQRECVHHLISYLDADHKHYNVVDFQDAAVPIINDLLAKRKLPVLVGGTNYYIESVLWNFLVDKKSLTVASCGRTQDTWNHSHHHILRKLERTVQPSSHPPLGVQYGKCLAESPAVYGPLKEDKQAMNVEKSLESGDVLMGPSYNKQDLNVGLGQVTSVFRVEPLLSAQIHSDQNTMCHGSFVGTLDSGSELQHQRESSFQTECHLRVSASESGMGSCVEVSSLTSGASRVPPSAFCLSAGLLNTVGVHESEIQSSNTEPVLCHRKEINRTSDTSSDLHTECDITSESMLTHGCVNTSTTDKDSPMKLPSDVSDNPGSSGGSKSHRLTLNLKDFRNDPNSLLKTLNGMSSEDLYALLQVVDPETSERLHPNNRRKLIRALQVYYETGRTLSSVLKEQHCGMENVKSGSLRYPDPCILWVKCGQPELDERLDSRVDDMMSRGLVSELENFHKEVHRLEVLKHNSRNQGGELAYPHGVLQMIGFKEFHDYLQLSPEERATELGQKHFQKGVSDLKQATRHYARQQIRWIKNRFCDRPGPDVPPVYSVSSTDLSQWDKAVEEAIEVVRSFVMGKTPTKAPELVSHKIDRTMVRNTCEVCGGKVFLYLREWAGHLKSKSHKHNVKMAAMRGKLLHVLSAREQQLKQMSQQTKLGGEAAENYEHPDRS